MFATRLAEEQSTNAGALRPYDARLAASLAPVEKSISAIQTRIRDAQGALAEARERIAQIHTS